MNTNKSTKTLQDRFNEKWMPEPYSGCWLWIGGQHLHGYGVFGIGRRSEGTRGAHRVSWELHYGKIPYGLNVCHTCDTPSCVNPKHLFLGTRKDNLHDASRKGRISRGEHRPLSKLTEDQVRNIRVSNETQRTLGERYGVCQQTVCEIKLGRQWAYL